LSTRLLPFPTSGSLNLFQLGCLKKPEKKLFGIVTIPPSLTPRGRVLKKKTYLEKKYNDLQVYPQRVRLYERPETLCKFAFNILKF